MNKYIYKLVESYFKDADSYESDIQGFENYSEIELQDIVENYCEEKIERYELDAFIVDSYISGSRKRGSADIGSDLDVEVYYTGSISEDSLFNILNDDVDDDPLMIENILVDINPKRVSFDEAEQRAQINNNIYKAQQYDQKILKKKRI